MLKDIDRVVNFFTWLNFQLTWHFIYSHTEDFCWAPCFQRYFYNNKQYHEKHKYNKQRKQMLVEKLCVTCVSVWMWMLDEEWNGEETGSIEDLFFLKERQMRILWKGKKTNPVVFKSAGTISSFIRIIGIRIKISY